MAISQDSGELAVPAEGSELSNSAILRRLVLAHQEGSGEAFTALVRLTFPSLYRHALRSLTDPRAAEDAVQESLLRAFRGLNGVGGDYQVAAWMHRILANVCADEGNRRRREALATARLSAQPEVHGKSPEESADWVEVSEAVSAAIASLPPNYREALLLRDVLELEYPDLASRVGISEDNARARVHRARAALRRLVSSSAVFGGAVIGHLRRIGRASAESAHHVATSAATVPPELLTAPSRVPVGATGFAAAAVAVAAAVPMFTGIGPGPAAVPGPSPVPNLHVTAGRGNPLGLPAAAVRVADADTRTTVMVLATTTSTEPTTTTTPSSRTVVTALTSDRKRSVAMMPTTTTTTEPPPPFPEADLAGPVQVSSGSQVSSLDGQDEFLFPSFSSWTVGGFQGTSALPPADSTCWGPFDGDFSWTDGAGHNYDVRLFGTISRSRSESGDVLYALAGAAVANGDPATGFMGPGRFVGTLRLASDGSATLRAQISDGTPAAVDESSMCASSSSTSNGAGDRSSGPTTSTTQPPTTG